MIRTDQLIFRKDSILADALRLFSSSSALSGVSTLILEKVFALFYLSTRCTMSLQSEWKVTRRASPLRSSSPSICRISCSRDPNSSLVAMRKAWNTCAILRVLLSLKQGSAQSQSCFVVRMGLLFTMASATTRGFLSCPNCERRLMSSSSEQWLIQLAERYDFSAGLETRAVPHVERPILPP